MMGNTKLEEVMGEKTVLMDVKETVLRYDAAVILRKIADDLAQGKFQTASGDVAVGDQIKLEVKGKMKPKMDVEKGSIEIELSWLAAKS